MVSSHIVIGAGEVGAAIYQVLADSYTAELRDVEPSGGEADVAHVCFPYSARFVADVREYQQQHSADLIVVHSTVPVGTCDQNGWVHSPVRGRHPELREGVETFVKHFGGKRAGEAARIFRDAGVATMTHAQAADTEAGKIWELAQYGLQIRVEKEFHAWCEARGIDFEVAYTLMAETYNEGYSKLGFDHFVRPILEHVPGEIGGHCVRENAWMVDHPIGDIVETGRWG